LTHNKVDYSSNHAVILDISYCLKRTEKPKEQYNTV